MTWEKSKEAVVDTHWKAEFRICLVIGSYHYSTWLPFAAGVRGVQRDPRSGSHRPGSRWERRHRSWGKDVSLLNSWNVDIHRHMICCWMSALNTMKMMGNQAVIQVFQGIHAPAHDSTSHISMVVRFFVCVVDCVYLGAAQDPGAGHHWAWGTRVEPSWGGMTDFQHCGHTLDFWCKADFTFGSEKSLHLKVVLEEVLFSVSSLRSCLCLVAWQAVGVSLPWQTLRHPLQAHLHVFNVNFLLGNARLRACPLHESLLLLMNT